MSVVFKRVVYRFFVLIGVIATEYQTGSCIFLLAIYFVYQHYTVCSHEKRKICSRCHNEGRCIPSDVSLCIPIGVAKIGHHRERADIAS